MEPHKRRQVITALLQESGEVTIEDLAIRLNVSENTVRNDLTAMEAENLLRRIRGGAIPVENDTRINNLMFATRSRVEQDSKRQIGYWAAQLVHDGDAIILDASSTVYHLATFLQDRRNLTVLTNGLDVALLLAKKPSNKLILASNIVRSDGLATIGVINPDLRSNFFAAKCFMSCAGFTVERGAMDIDVDEVPLKAQMIELAQAMILLADHSKFEKIATYSFARLNQIDHLITDDAIAPDYLTSLRQVAHFPITIVGDATTRTLEPAGTLPTDPTYRIGFGNMSERMVFPQQVRRSLEQAARRFPNIELLIRDNDLDRRTALENADWFVSRRVDLVIEYQIDAKAGNIIMDKFNQAGIPVIAVDIPLPGATFFGANNYRAGYIAGEALGEWITQHWQGQLDILLKLESPRIGVTAATRLQGLQEGLESVVGSIADEQIQIVNSPLLVHDVPAAVAGLLPLLPLAARIAIIAINDEVAVGALEAFEKANRLGQVVAVGQNADQIGLEALRRHDFPFIGSTRFAPEEYGEQLLHLAFKILSGAPVPPAVYNQHIFLNRDNLREYYADSVEIPMDIP